MFGRGSRVRGKGSARDRKAMVWSRVSAQQLEAGRRIWAKIRRDDPTPLPTAARSGVADLPRMAKAIQRHCRELPWLQDGPSLTERLVLQLLTEGSRTVGQIYSALMQEREPPPWLGDVMLLFIHCGQHEGRQ